MHRSAAQRRFRRCLREPVDRPVLEELGTELEIRHAARREGDLDRSGLHAAHDTCPLRHVRGPSLPTTGPILAPMGYPQRLLYEGEEVVLDIRPHWVALLVPGLWTLLIVAVLVAVAFLVDDVTSVWYLALLVAGLVAFVFLAGYRWLRWLTTEFVLTTERVISRRGIYAKSSKDIPLERINDVTFTQSVLERFLRSG
ncbi:MAG: hypothetical protein DYH08_17640, partial [Actinobacteria bacterium ATB1]|nr:hypothetical protein [Actinobacteria bacterium ATB1]